MYLFNQSSVLAGRSTEVVLLYLYETVVCRSLAVCLQNLTDGSLLNESDKAACKGSTFSVISAALAPHSAMHEQILYSQVL